MKINLTQSQLKEVLHILHQTVPKENIVYAFGSRVKNTAKRFSDLDIAFDYGRPMTLGEIADLRELFEESDLPFTVDLVDIHSIDDSFKKHILKQFIKIDRSTSP